MVVALLPLLWLVSRALRGAANNLADRLRVAPPPPPSPPLPSPTERLLLAQHWARGALMSRDVEPWRPICSAAAIAALCSPDLRALSELLREQTAAGTDPQVANVWRQVQGELIEAEAGRGLAIDEPERWPFAALRAKNCELLESARRGAEQLVTSASTPPPPNS